MKNENCLKLKQKYPLLYRGMYVETEVLLSEKIQRWLFKFSQNVVKFFDDKFKLSWESKRRIFKVILFFDPTKIDPGVNRKIEKVRTEYSDYQQHCIFLFGIECGDGWFDLIDQLSAKLEPLIEEANKLDEFGVYVCQVKEKFGTLRFYLSSGTDEMYKLIDDAEERSAKTCELCGADGEILGDGWLSCRCENCAKKIS